MTGTSRAAALAAAGAILALTGNTNADEIGIRIQNMMDTGGFFFTPVWVGVHNGGFDSYDGGTMASMWPGLTEIAEGGDTAPLSAAFDASAAGIAGGVQSTITAVNGGGDAPVFSPGESTTITLDVGDSAINRYFSYASMIIPSNDLFFANGNPFSHEVFDAGGNFNGPIVIDIYGDDVNDNGTEVNDAFGGAAFSANGGADADETELIRNFFSMPGDPDYLSSFVGTQTVTGDTINYAFGEGTLLARITIVPAPGALALFGLAGFTARRRRRS